MATSNQQLHPSEQQSAAVTSSGGPCETEPDRAGPSWTREVCPEPAAGVVPTLRPAVTAAAVAGRSLDVKRWVENQSGSTRGQH